MNSWIKSILIFKIVRTKFFSKKNLEFNNIIFESLIN